MSSLVAALLARWGFTGNAAHTRPIYGPDATNKNRYNVPNSTYAVATNSVTWTAVENVTEFWVTFYPDAVTTAGKETIDHAWMVIDAPSDAIAALQIVKAAGASADSPLFPIPFNTRVGPFTGKSYFSRLDFDTDQTGELFVEAS